VRKEPVPWWIAWSLLPFGWTTWIGFIQAGRRLQKRAWYGIAAAYLAATVVEFTLVSIDQDDKGLDHSLAGATIIIFYLVGIGHSLVVAPGWRRRVALLEDPALQAARTAEDRRALALELARDDPRLARAAQLGRHGGFDEGGIVDANHAALEELADLPEVDVALARRIVEVRDQIHGFSSLEDMGMTLDLPGDLVEGLRGRLVFLPR